MTQYQYDDILNNPNLTKEQKVKAIQERGKQNEKDIMQSYAKDTAKMWGTEALELGGSIPFGLGAYKGYKWIKGIQPYLGDIWAGRNLILDRFFPNQNKIKQDGENFYQYYLQKKPANIAGYGEIKFGRNNKGKDLTENFLEYPFLRKKLESSNKIKTTNYKEEPDRVYDYFKNSDKGDIYNYVIENINNVGKRYKMMHNKTKGQ